MSRGDQLEFGPFRLDGVERELLLDGVVVPLTGKAFNVLQLLVMNRGRTVTKEEFMAEVWAGTAVEEGNLADKISTLRQALNDDAREPLYIQTVQRRGYRFVAEVRPVGEATPEVATVPVPDAPAAERPRVSRARWGWMVAAALALVVAGVVAWFSRDREVAGPRSLAVLPFKPLSASDRDPAMELGMADALISKLSRVREIHVRPTAAVMPYAGSSEDIREIADRLGVDTILDGKVQKSGNRVRVSVQLVRASDGATLWGDRFDERFTDIFALQDAISERVASALAVRLTTQERSSIGKRPTANVEAYHLYLNGFNQWRTFSRDGLLASINYFNAAIAVDPQFALAWAGLGRSYSVIAVYGPLQPREAYPKAQSAVARALKLDPSLVDAHIVNVAVKCLYEREWEEARRELDLIERLDPENGEMHTFRGYYLTAMGRPEEAIPELDRALQRAPDWSVARNDALKVRLDARRYDEVISRAEKALQLQPNQYTTQRILGLAYAGKGDYDKATLILERTVAMAQGSSSHVRAIAALAWTHAKAGRRDKALALLEQARRDTTPWMSLEVARIYAGLGDRDQAFAWLNRAQEERSSFLYEFRVQFTFDDLRGDPRFGVLLGALNLP